MLILGHWVNLIPADAASWRPAGKQAVWEADTICPRPCKLTFDHLTLKVVSESRMTWATSANFSLPRPSVLDLGPLYVTDRQISDAHHRLMPPLWERGHKNGNSNLLHLVCTAVCTYTIQTGWISSEVLLWNCGLLLRLWCAHYPAAPTYCIF